MEIEIRNKMEKFFNTYSAHFGKLTTNDGIGIYEDWLKSKFVNIDAAINALDRIADSGERKFKPRLGQIKRVMRECKYEQRQESQPDRKYVIPHCHDCNNTGKGWVVMGLIDGKRNLVNDNNRDRATDLKLTEHPCQCPRGIPQTEILFKLAKSFEDYMNTAKLLKLGWKKWFRNQSAAREYANSVTMKFS